jgi:tetratricopeptide (TPR) repeat protein
MPGEKRKTDVKLEINDSSNEKRVRLGQENSDASFFVVKQESDDFPEGPEGFSQEPEEIQGVKLKQKKREVDEDLGSEESKVKRIKVSKEEDKVIKQEGYSSDDDVIILDVLSKRNERDVVSKSQDGTVEKRKANGSPETNGPLKEKMLKTNHGGIVQGNGKQSEAAQEQDRSAKPVNKAKQVEGYYSNDDVTMLLDALLKRNGFERIRGGDHQDIVRDVQAAVNTRTMVLAPIAEGSEEAIAGLIRDVTRARNHDIEQILVPVNMPGIHWYTIQLLMLQSPDGYSLDARIHDSLGIRKGSVIVEKLATSGIVINSHIEGNLPKIQLGELGAKNVYCGGYTARLIANLALNSRMLGEEAWGCPNNMDDALRREDVGIVNEHNSASVGSFGRRAVAVREILDTAHYMSTIRSILAEEKKFKLLQELEAKYENMSQEIKTSIEHLRIPEDPVKLFAIIRDLYVSLPLLKGLFHTNAQGEIEKDAEGILKLDMNIEIGHIHKIMVEFQKKCSQIGKIVVAELQNDEAEPGDQEMTAADKHGDGAENPALLADEQDDDYSNVKLTGVELESIKKGLENSESSLKMLQALYKDNHPSVATFLSYLGTAHGKLGNYKDSLDYHKQALKMRKALYEGDHSDVAESLDYVGNAYRLLEDYKKSLNAYEQALKIRQALYEGDHPDVAESLNNVGNAYSWLENYGKVLEYHEQALKMRQALYEGDHPDVAGSLTNVGNAYYMLKDYKKSLNAYEQALKMRQALYEGDHPDVAESLTNVGHVYSWLKNYGKALKHYEQALKMRQALYEGDHPDVAESLTNVGNACDKLNHIRKSCDYYKRALAMNEALYKGDHEDIAFSLNSVGLAYTYLKEVKESIGYLERSLAMRQALHQDNHPDVADSFDNVGLAYQKLGNVKKGITYLESALTMRQALYQGNHPDVADSLNNLALAYKKSGDLDRSLEYQNRAKMMKDARKKSLKKKPLKKPHGQGKKGKKEFKGQGTLGYVDSGYPEYYNSGLDQILELRLNSLGSNSNAVALKFRYFEEGLGSAGQLARDVMVTFSDSSIQIVLAPFNLYGKHWLGLLFRNLGAVLEVTYMDSEQVSMLPELRAGLENGLAVNGYESRFLEARLAPQRYNNCGYEVIENFVYYLTGARATQEAAVYVHSLLVENSLLDPQEYGLKIEENNRLLGFLSNVAPISIRSIDVFLNVNVAPIHHYEGRSTAIPLRSVSFEGQTTHISNDGLAINLLPAIKQFNRLWAKMLRDKLRKTNAVLHKTTMGFNALDVVVDSARLAHQPTALGFKKVVLDYAHLRGMYEGVNTYSLVISGAEAVYQVGMGEYHKAFDVVAGTLNAMALPFILARVDRPYLGFAYGAWMVVNTAYHAVINAYSFVLEITGEDAQLKSKVAYKDLTEWLSASPLQALHGFDVDAQNYALQINDILFKKEKATIEAQLKEQGEFGQKVFNYIALPSLLEKYSLLNDVARGMLTQEEADSLKSQPVAMSDGALHYDHCMESRHLTGAEEDTKHYYCYSLERQILEHVAVIGGNHIEVLERL